jgi:hypothetical protein
MKYRKRSDGSLATKSQLKAENPNTSLPKTWTAETLDFLGVDPVLASPKPPVGDYEIATRDGVEQVEGNWVEKWKVQPMFVEYEVQVDGNDVDLGSTVVTVEEQIAEYDAQQLQKKREGMSATNEDLRLALNSAGVYQTLMASKALVENPELDIRFQFAVTINRLDEWFIEATEGLMTDEQLDDLFEAAHS